MIVGGASIAEIVKYHKNFMIKISEKSTGSWKEYKSIAIKARFSKVFQRPNLTFKLYLAFMEHKKRIMVLLYKFATCHHCFLKPLMIDRQFPM
jgi:hypothetical protein